MFDAVKGNQSRGDFRVFESKVRDFEMSTINVRRRKINLIMWL